MHHFSEVFSVRYENKRTALQVTSAGWEFKSTVLFGKVAVSIPITDMFTQFTDVVY